MKKILNIVIFIIEFTIQKYYNKIVKYIKFSIVKKILLNILNNIINYNYIKFCIYLNNQFEYQIVIKINQLIQIIKNIQKLEINFINIQIIIIKN